MPRLSSSKPGQVSSKLRLADCKNSAEQSMPSKKQPLGPSLQVHKLAEPWLSQKSVCRVRGTANGKLSQSTIVKIKLKQIHGSKCMGPAHVYHPYYRLACRPCAQQQHAHLFRRAFRIRPVLVALPHPSSTITDPGTMCSMMLRDSFFSMFTSVLYG